MERVIVRLHHAHRVPIFWKRIPEPGNESVKIRKNRPGTLFADNHALNENPDCDIIQRSGLTT